MVKKITLPVQLILVIALVLLAGNYIPLYYKNFFYTLSLNIKEVLIFVMPFIIFSFIFSCLLELENKVFLFVGLLLLCVCGSNFLSTLLSYGVASMSLHHFQVTLGPLPLDTHLVHPLWDFALPGWIPNQDAMLGAFILGITGSIWRTAGIQKTAVTLRTSANWFLNTCFLPLMPLFVFGLILKTHSDSHLFESLLQYASIFMVMMGVTLLYLLVLTAIAAGFQFKQMVAYLKNILPASLTALSSLSSAAAMPLSIRAGEANTGRPQIVKTVIPSTVGIHLIGDSICVPIMGMIVMAAFGMPIPTFEQYLPFSLAFILAKFAIAAVPMGGMIVMLPVFKASLGFTTEMLGLMTALYLIFDAFMTACNTTGNGIFVIIFNRVLKFFRI